MRFKYVCSNSSKGEDQNDVACNMWLWYDWQAAAVVNAEGAIFDQDNWDGFYDQRAVVERLECIAQGGLTPSTTFTRTISEAKPLYTVRRTADYPLPTIEAQNAVDLAAIALANRGVAQAAGDPQAPRTLVKSK